MNIDLIIKIVMYAILAIIPISVILIVFFNKTKLVQEMAKESNKKSKNRLSNSDNLFSDNYETSSRDHEMMFNPSYSSYSQNIYHSDKD